MIRYRGLAAGIALLVAGSMAVQAQSAHPGFDPLQTFARLTLPEPVNRYRSADGSPGPDYWQNRADYEIHARLDPTAHRLEGSEIITYTNNSPAALGYLWVQLDQNMYRPDSRSFYGSGFARTQSTTGYELESVEVIAGGRRSSAEYVVSDTRMQIRLAQPLAHAAKLQLAIHYHYEVPGAFGGRTAYSATRNGEIYDIAQWYPRMAVYDDLRGWDTLPYVGSEFYLEYGNFDYYVTVPWDFLMAGSGELQNPQQVLTALQRQRLEQARASDQTVIIRGPEEIGDPASRPVHSGELTWHYRMQSTRDVAFTASRAFIWDAARIRLPDNGASIAMSFYPIEAQGADMWGRSTEYLKHAVEEFSRRWAPYPYPAAINSAGEVSGMEYPGLLFDGIDLHTKDLFWLTAHEIGHTWFPMMVGFDERRDAWMDEGFNSFIDVYESDAFENGVYGPKRDQEYAPGGGNPVDDILPLLNDPAAPPILTNADEFPRKYGHQVSYFKSALGLILLREQILGTERFDWAFRRFIREWSYKHPSPSDFFRFMDSAAGEDLSWFWRGWYFNNWTLDLAVEDVKYVNGDPKQGALVTIANLNPLVMPATVQIDFADGTNRRLRLPVETWLQKSRYTATLDSHQPITAVTVDPDHVLPDNDRSNNVFRPAAPAR
jgi:Peptidase family M1 domain